MITRTNEQAYAAPRPKKESGFVSRFLPLARRIGRTPQGSPGSADFSRSPDGVRINAAAKITGKLGGAWNVGCCTP